MNKPTLVYHADWSSSPAKRWCAKATLGVDGRYIASAPTPVGDLPVLLTNLRDEAGAPGTVFAGFDFPIGIPAHFADRAGIFKFPDFLKLLGTGVWKDFYSVCDTPEQVSIHRPFFPNQSLAGHRHNHIFDAHDAVTMLDLLRLCERRGDGQRQGCCLFWTLGANAVGKSALKGWEHVLVPALGDNSVRLWPFDGSLDALFQPGHTVIAETYPAECYGWFPGDPLRSKTDLKSRQNFGSKLLSWAAAAGVVIEAQLKIVIEAGFPIGQDDSFDALVGLFGMLKVCLGERGTGEPDDKTVREVEGWILGRQSQPAAAKASMPYSANNDPDLRDWLRWTTESDVPVFVKTVAEAASIADLPSYALLRRVLLELKRQYPFRG